MVDRQFSHQNGVSVAILPTPNLTPTPEPKWITPEIGDKYVSRKGYQVDDNMSTVERAVLCLSEIFGTAILVFLGCLGCVNGMMTIPVSSEQVSLTFGLAIMISVQVFGHISGCHINPIVTVAAATIGNIPLIQVPIFIVGQMLGGLAGFGLIKAVTPADILKPKLNESVGLCSPNFHGTLSPLQALVVEFLLSLILVWVCCSLWDSRNREKNDSTPIRLGLTIAGLAMVGGPYTGAHMNPARSFAPALINGDWNYHWIYWVGPLGAGFFGALFYKLVFSKDTTAANETYPETSMDKT